MEVENEVMKYMEKIKRMIQVARQMVDENYTDGDIERVLLLNFMPSPSYMSVVRKYIAEYRQWKSEVVENGSRKQE